MSEKRFFKKSGVTIVEVLVSFFILVLVFGGILYSFIRCLEFIELSRNMSRAVQTAQSRMDQIRSTSYNLIASTYDTVPFTIPDLDGMGVVYVDNSVADLLEVRVVICWRNKYGRIYGEDDDLDGLLDGGEDDNGNLELDSPVELVTRIFRK